MLVYPAVSCCRVFAVKSAMFRCWQVSVALTLALSGEPDRVFQRVARFVSGVMVQIAVKKSEKKRQKIFLRPAV